MINIEYTGKCKDCRCVELGLEDTGIFFVNGEPRNVYKLRCIHEDACQNMINRISNIAERISRKEGFDRT